MSPKATSRASTWLDRSESALRWNCCTVIVVIDESRGATTIGVVNMNEVTGDDGDARTGDGRSLTREEQAEGRTGPKAGGRPTSPSGIG